MSNIKTIEEIQQTASLSEIQENKISIGNTNERLSYPIDNELPDNGQHLISAEDLRGVLHNMVDKAPFIIGDREDGLSIKSFTYEDLELTEKINKAYGKYSVIEGYNNITGELSEDGNINDTVGNCAHAEGSSNIAIGNASHVEGSRNVAADDCAHAEGQNTNATAPYSHAEGYNTEANGYGSHAEGGYYFNNNNYKGGIANGYASHAEGIKTITNGIASHAEGYGTITYNTGEHASGKYNESTEGTIFSVGIGESNTDRKNAVEIRKVSDDYKTYISTQTNIGEVQSISQTKDTVLNIGGDVYIEGNIVTIGTHTVVDLETDTANELIVRGETNLQGDTVLDKSLTVNGETSLNDVLTVKGETNLQDNTVLNKSLIVKGETNLQGDTVLYKSLIVNGETRLNDILTVNAETKLNDVLTVNDETILNDALTVKNETNLQGDTVLDKSLTVKGDTVLDKSLTVNGETTLNDATTIDNTLVVTKAAYLPEDTFINGKKIEEKIQDDITGRLGVEIDSNYNNGGVKQVNEISKEFYYGNYALTGPKPWSITGNIIYSIDTELFNFINTVKSTNFSINGAKLINVDSNRKTVTFDDYVDFYWYNNSKKPISIENKFYTFGYYINATAPDLNTINYDNNDNFEIIDIPDDAPTLLKLTTSALTSNAAGEQSIATNASYAFGILSNSSNTAVANADYSTAEGIGIVSKKLGKFYHARTIKTNNENGVGGSYGFSSHVEGGLTITTTSAAFGHAEGHSTVSDNFAAHAEGRKTYSGGMASHAEGSGPIALGYGAHAEGISTNEYHELINGSANGANSIEDILEKWNETKNFSMAYGKASHVEGENNLSIADYSHAGGKYNKNNGESSLVFGSNNINNANNSVIFGSNNSINNDSSDSFAFGNNCVINNSKYSFVGGNGAKIELTTPNKNYCNFVFGSGTVAHGSSTTYGNITLGTNSISYKQHSIAIGHGTELYDNVKDALNLTEYLKNRNFHYAGNKNSIAIGHDSYAAGNSSITLGTGLVAQNQYEIALGHYNKSDKLTVFSIGNGTLINPTNVFEIKNNNNAYFSGDIYEKGIKLSEKYSNIKLKHIDETETSVNINAPIYIDGIEKDLVSALAESEEITAYALADLDNKIRNTNVKLKHIDETETAVNINAPIYIDGIEKDLVSALAESEEITAYALADLDNKIKAISETQKTTNAVYESSDERLKTFENSIEVDFDKLAKLRKAYFTFNSNPDKHELGVSAQEIKEIYPEIVTENSDGYLSVNYSKLSVIALKAIDKLNDRLSKIEKLLNI